MAVVRIPIKLANKANRYQIRFNQRLWKLIEPIVAQFREGNRGRGSSPFWIGPDLEVKKVEMAIALFFRNQEKREWLHREPLSLKVRLYGQRVDVDGIKIIMDSIQRSGRITNDNQIRRLTVEHIELGRSGPVQPAIEVEVEPLWSERR